MSKKHVISAKEISNLLAGNAPSGSIGFFLKVKLEDFAFLYIDSEYYSIAWKGEVDFSDLHNCVFGSFADHVIPNIPLLSGKSLHKADNIDNISNVTFVIGASPSAYDPSEDDVSLREFQIDENSEQAYKDILTEHQKILFVRYDVHMTSSYLPGRYIDFSFTAENSKFLEKGSAEIGVRQPRSQLHLVDLLKWISDHHTNDFSNMLNYKESADVLIELIKKNGDGGDEGGGGSGKSPSPALPEIYISSSGERHVSL